MMRGMGRPRIDPTGDIVEGQWLLDEHKDERFVVVGAFKSSDSSLRSFKVRYAVQYESANCVDIQGKDALLDDQYILLPDTNGPTIDAICEPADHEFDVEPLYRDMLQGYWTAQCNNCRISGGVLCEFTDQNLDVVFPWICEYCDTVIPTGEKAHLSTIGLRICDDCWQEHYESTCGIRHERLDQYLIFHSCSWIAEATPDHIKQWKPEPGRDFNILPGSNTSECPNCLATGLRIAEISNGHSEMLITALSEIHSVPLEELTSQHLFASDEQSRRLTDAEWERYRALRDDD
jgi:hypothetical protein